MAEERKLVLTFSPDSIGKYQMQHDGFITFDEIVAALRLVADATERQILVQQLHASLNARTQQGIVLPDQVARDMNARRGLSIERR